MVLRKFLVIESFNGYEKDMIIKECKATDGTDRIYYTTGNGDISFGDIEEHKNNLKVLIDKT